ncbi:hypothetical protein BGLA2_1700036 [Burkholderia gladioli]|nr:hypothetical protein BGLA2_1700036 [Burkholderia gladioli]
MALHHAFADSSIRAIRFRFASLHNNRSVRRQRNDARRDSQRFPPSSRLKRPPRASPGLFKFRRKPFPR